MTTQNNQPALPDMKQALSGYVRKNIISNFDDFQFIEKLALAQSTPKDKVLSRKIGTADIKYLPYQYCQKVLNFLFGFKISNELVDIEWVERTEEKDNWVYDPALKKRVIKGKKSTTVVECDVTMKYTFTFPDGTTQVRTVGGSHKQYSNPAVTRGMCKQAAISKSWTAVAKTFGIGVDLDKEPEDKLYDKMYEEEVINVDAQDVQPTDNGLGY